MQAPTLRPAFIILIVVMLIGGYLLIERLGAKDLYLDVDAVIFRLQQLGITGPLLVIGLMTLAIVFNPLPSAPIALAAGAVYGHTLGTVYIVIGAEIGAAIAFIIARLAGFQITQKYIGKRWTLKRFTTQNSLMTIIFVSRLVPFLSFDLVSYAAGLTPITFWRFALATLFGLIPTSFLLAHFGGEMIEANFKTTSIFILLIGLITVIPILFKTLGTNRNETPGDS
jgi:uncharacterized membrane protein YdjX (TVP38/TMEM64 family)